MILVSSDEFKSQIPFPRCDLCNGILIPVQSNNKPMPKYYIVYQECVKCLELFIHIKQPGTSINKWYRFYDEATDELPEPLNKYVLGEGFVVQDLADQVLIGHKWGNHHDRFAFGRGALAQTPEELVFGDMDYSDKDYRNV